MKQEAEDLSYALGMIRERERMNKQSGIELPDWIDRDAWDGWVAKRRQMKNPVTERIARMAIRKLEEIKNDGYDPNATLNEAEFRGWRGLFPVEGSNVRTTNDSKSFDRSRNEGTDAALRRVLNAGGIAVEKTKPRLPS